MNRTVTLHFEIEYHVSSPDYSLVWEGEISSPEGYNKRRALSMQLQGKCWHLSLELPEQLHGDGSYVLSYNYLLEKEGVPIRYEAPAPHTLIINPPLGEDVRIKDRWIDPSPLHRLNQYPIAPLLHPKSHEVRPITLDALTVTIRAVHLPHLLTGQLFVCGASEHLGAWDLGRSVPLSRSGDDYYFVSREGMDTEYKFVFRLEDGTYLWERGDNRWLHPSEGSTIHFVHPPDFDVALDQLPHQLSGTVLPLFSLRTDRSFGVGDFDDALLLLEWLKETRQTVYQLLPIYDTSFTGTLADTYPYNSITTYGLHPLYLSVRDLPYYSTSVERDRWEREALRLNVLPTVAYTEVLDLKWEVIRDTFARWYDAGGHETQEYRSFLEEEGEDLMAYSLFCVLRDRHPHREVVDYPPYAMVRREWEELRSVEGKDATSEVELHNFVQYHLYRQLATLSRRAKEYSILLKGDLPIGVGRNSVDVWVSPHLFDIGMNAGAPPDAFSANGQIWGFPTYNWERMRADEYRWWRRRLSTMERYFSAIRIDHILGFFRIWSVPRGETDPCLGRFVPALGYSVHELADRGISPEGLDKAGDPDRVLLKDEDGLYHPRVMLSRLPLLKTLDDGLAQRLIALHDEYFYHRNESLWRQTAIERIRGLMSASRMLLCAEDLGMLPHSVSEVLSSCEILSLEILRMPKSPVASIVRSEDIPMLSVLSTSTHDMPTLRGWWQERSERERTELETYYNTSGVSPLTPAGLISALFDSAALFVILPLQDWCVLSGYGSDVDPKSERINIPEDPRHIWDYRMSGSIEALRADEVLKERIKALTHDKSNDPDR